MRTWRIRLSELRRQLRIARDQGRSARLVQRDQQAADELDRARAGVDRFPRGGGGI